MDNDLRRELNSTSFQCSGAGRHDPIPHQLVSSERFSFLGQCNSPGGWIHLVQGIAPRWIKSLHVHRSRLPLF